MTVCRQLNLGYASDAVTQNNFSETGLEVIMSGVKCRVDEISIYNCEHDEWENATCSSKRKSAGVICVSGELCPLTAGLDTVAIKWIRRRELRSRRQPGRVI